MVANQSKCNFATTFFCLHLQFARQPSKKFIITTKRYASERCKDQSWMFMHLRLMRLRERVRLSSKPEWRANVETRKKMENRLLEFIRCAFFVECWHCRLACEMHFCYAKERGNLISSTMLQYPENADQWHTPLHRNGNWFKELDRIVITSVRLHNNNKHKSDARLFGDIEYPL